MAARAGKRRSKRTVPVVTLEGEEARVQLLEGVKGSVPLVDLVDGLHPQTPDSVGAVLPDGVKCLWPATSGGFIAVHQTPPSVFLLRWIAEDSPAPYGVEARYRDVRVALPYVIVLALFEGVWGRVPQLSSRNECFFSNQPLDVAGIDTELCYPALLNCSRFPTEPGRPLSWICTQNLDPERFAGRPSLPASLRDGLHALLQHLLESAFNLSSEHHELSSWYTESVAAGIDPRIASLEKWEKATHDDPLFVLDVPWLSSGRSLGAVAARMAAGNVDAPEPRPVRSRSRFRTSTEVARVILNAQGRQES